MSQGNDPERKKSMMPDDGRSLWTARAPAGNSPLSALSRSVDPAVLDRDIAASADAHADELARPFVRTGGEQELGDILLD